MLWLDLKSGIKTSFNILPGLMWLFFAEHCRCYYDYSLPPINVVLIQLACNFKLFQKDLACHTKHTLCFFLPFSLFSSPFKIKNQEDASFYKWIHFSILHTLHQYAYYNSQNEDAKTELELFFIHLLQGQIIEITCIKHLLVYITQSSTACYIKYRWYIKKKMSMLH